MISYGAEDWLRLGIDWDKVDSDRARYQMSCDQFFRKNKFYKFFDLANDPKKINNYSRIYQGNNRRDLKQGNNILYHFPRKKKYFIQTMCIADENIDFCKYEDGQTKRKCESKKSCVWIPSRYFHEKP